MKRLSIAAVGTVFLLLAGGAVSAQSPTMYTLGDIYYYLVEGTEAVEGGHTLEPPAGAVRGDTRFKTLKEIYEGIKAEFDRCDALPSDVAEGKRFFCVRAGNWGGRAGTASPRTSLLRTGQELSYYDHDDGWYEKGTGYSYTDNGDGTVTDNVTGLTWPQDGEGAGCRSGSTKASMYYATTWAEELRFAGYSDWRLPNIRELFSLVVEDAARGGPYVNRDYFFNIKSSYWSSTMTPDNFPTYVFYVAMNQGTMGIERFLGAVRGKYVWAVRGGN